METTSPFFFFLAYFEASSVARVSLGSFGLADRRSSETLAWSVVKQLRLISSGNLRQPNSVHLRAQRSKAFASFCGERSRRLS